MRFRTVSGSSSVSCISRGQDVLQSVKGVCHSGSSGWLSDSHEFEESGEVIVLMMISTHLGAHQARRSV